MVIFWENRCFFSNSMRTRHHDAARVMDFPAAPPLRIGEQEVQLQPSSHTSSAPPLDATDLALTAVTPLALKIEFLFFPFILPHTSNISTSAPPFLSLPWRRRTAWRRTACYSGGDLRVTRAASPRCALATCTEQVRGRGFGVQHACWTYVGCLSPDQSAVLRKKSGA